MKIRRGFVSNSSSSSFTCDVCGNTESGMDAGLSDFEMSQCEHGHTFCNGHQTHTATIEEKRKYLIENTKSQTYRSEEKIKEEVDRFTTLSDDDIEFEYEDSVGSYEVPACTCPICRMEKMSDYDALKYLLVKNGLTINDILVEVRDRFNGDYQAFDTFIRPPKSN